MKRSLLVNTSLLNGRTPPVLKAAFVPSFISFKLLVKSFFVLIPALVCINIYAQGNNSRQQGADYLKVITERSAKIVNVLGLTDSGKYSKVLNEIVSQYSQLNSIHEQSKAAVAEIKVQSLSNDAKAEAIKKSEEKKYSELLQLHGAFIAHLKENLTEEQMDKVKDGMTYSVFPITYAAYQDMLPALSTEQKDKIYNWLKEARELAMDEGTSDDKHKVFGKYKGRINNYLSAAGFDMKKEGEEWQKRIKERQERTKDTRN
jgi:hypothetical protein